MQHPLVRLFPRLNLELGVPEHAYPAHATTFRYLDAAGLARGHVVAGLAPNDPDTVEIFHLGALFPERGDRAQMLDTLCRYADSAHVRLRLMPPLVQCLHEVENRYNGPEGTPPITLRDSVHRMGFHLGANYTRSRGAGTLPPPGPPTVVTGFSGTQEAALLVAAWPGGAKAAANAIGISQGRLAAYLAEREALSGAEVSALRRVFALGFDVNADLGVIPELQGAYALDGEVPRAKVLSLYDTLSHGGDLLLAGEIIPSSGPADSARRFLVLEAHGGEPCVISFTRGGQSAAVLDEGSDTLINLSGAITVSRALYDRVRTAVDHAFAAPPFAAAAGNLFAAEWIALTERLDEVEGIGFGPRDGLVDPALRR